MTRWIKVAGVLAVIAIIAAVLWAVTARPAGSAGLDQILADRAGWPGQPASAAATERVDTWRSLLTTYESIVEAAHPAEFELAWALDDFTILDLAWPNEVRPWSMWARDGGETIQAIRSALIVRAEALLGSGIITGLAELAEGPRPAASAEQLAAVGFGSQPPFLAGGTERGRCNQASKDLIGLAHLQFDDDDPAALAETLRAIEGLARGMEATPAIAAQTTASGTRLRLRGVIIERVARGPLATQHLAVIASAMQSDEGAPEPDDVVARAFAGERAILHGTLGHLYTASGIAVPTVWDDARMMTGLPDASIVNAVGLVMPRRAAVAARLDEVLDGTVDPPKADFGLLAFRNPDVPLTTLTPLPLRLREVLRGWERSSAMVEIALAIAHFELEHGAPPERLDDLGLPPMDPADRAVLGAVRLVPHDPASDHRGIRWRLVGDGADPDVNTDDLQMPSLRAH